MSEVLGTILAYYWIKVISADGTVLEEIDKGVPAARLGEVVAHLEEKHRAALQHVMSQIVIEPGF